MRIRFLPLTMFAAALMLTVKISDIWDGLAGGTVTVARAQAQQSKSGEPSASVEKDAVTEEKTTAGGTDDKGDGAAPAEGAGAGRLASDDPTLLTQAEIDLLQQLAERREALEAQERELEMRTGLLKAAEARIDKKVEELKQFQATITQLIKTYDEQQDAKTRSLVKIYENMKPKDAARIFEEMDLDTLLMVVERMKERKLAPIMAKMDPSKATEITVELSRLRQLPKPGAAVGG
jgi:flagellar motility protein MotE (MotC chaperone)